jgi:hypothetical protein
MDNYFVDDRFSDIAKGKTAFCIFGGPSAKNVDNMDYLIENNFTVTVNKNIVSYPNVDMYVTADNMLTRLYFEKDDFFLHKYIRGNMTRTRAIFDYELEPIWYKTERSVIDANKDMLKIIGCNVFPCYNTNFTVGQTYYLDGIKFAKYTENTYICIEHREEKTGESYPLLTLEDESTVFSYGKNPKNLISGGNIASIVFQLLKYMGFSKIIVVGYGDIGISNGYDNATFEWSIEELHGMSVHSHIWGENFKVLSGGELLDKYGFVHGKADISEMENKNDKKELINKFKSL